MEDRISLTVAGDDEVRAAATTHEQLVASETLATSYAVVDAVSGTEVALGDGRKATIALAKA